MDAMTDGELLELETLLQGTHAHLAEHTDDEGVKGLIVEFDNGKHFRGVMHPRVALEMLREKGDGVLCQVLKKH